MVPAAGEGPSSSVDRGTADGDRWATPTLVGPQSASNDYTPSIKASVPVMWGAEGSRECGPVGHLGRLPGAIPVSGIYPWKPQPAGRGFSVLRCSERRTISLSMAAEQSRGVGCRSWPVRRPSWQPPWPAWMRAYADVLALLNIRVPCTEEVIFAMPDARSRGSECLMVRTAGRIDGNRALPLLDGPLRPDNVVSRVGGHHVEESGTARTPRRTEADQTRLPRVRQIRPRHATASRIAATVAGALSRSWAITGHRHIPRRPVARGATDT